MTDEADSIIAFQGAPGAYSDVACRHLYPEMSTLACASFEDVFAAVVEGQAALAMIPIENSVAGRVADIHHLMPTSDLHIIGEHFQPINHRLLAIRGAMIDGLRTVHSHVHALAQCRDLIRRLGVTPMVHTDTAAAAQEIAEREDPSMAAIGSSLAAEIYDLATLESDIEDAEHNTTRFLIMARSAITPPAAGPPAVTSFIFEVRSVPAALYKALGGFATNGVNMTKLESYMVGGNFAQAAFYADIEGHPEHRLVRLAMEELEFFSRKVRILGVYPAHPHRLSEIR
ncbi:MAG: prephenate dehydratase [Alphaproteobacteria bacterium]|nr:prephenate dehydratase [Alphaproteobacteria bacterium]